MKAVLRGINKIEEYIPSMLLILTSILVFVQLVLRYQFNYSLSWAEEMARLMIAWFIFLGSSLAVKENAHVNMDALLVVLPKKGKQIAGILIDIVNLIFCAIIVYAGIGMIINAAMLGSRATSMNIPLYIPYASVPVGVSFMFLHYLVNLVEKIKILMNFKSKKEGDAQ